MHQHEVFLNLEAHKELANEYMIGPNLRQNLMKLIETLGETLLYRIFGGSFSSLSCT